MAAPGAEGRPWTREQIEAWVEQPKDRAARVSRRALVRFCPEVADYEDLKRRINAATKIHWVPRSWRESLSEEEIAEYVRASVAALWDQSLSEPSDGEARRA